MRIVNTFVPLNREQFEEEMKKIRAMSPVSTYIVPLAITYDLSGSEYDKLEYSKKLVKSVYECASSHQNKILFYLLHFVLYEGQNYLIKVGFADEISKEEADEVFNSITDCYGNSPLADVVFTADNYLETLCQTFESIGQIVAVPTHVIFSSDLIDDLSYNRKREDVSSKINYIREKIRENERSAFEINLCDEITDNDNTLSFGGINLPANEEAINKMVGVLSVASSSVNVGGDRRKFNSKELRRKICEQIYSLSTHIL